MNEEMINLKFDILEKKIDDLGKILMEQIEMLQKQLVEQKNQVSFGSEKCRDRHEGIAKELGGLSIKASFMGAIAGGIAGGILGFIQLILFFFK